MQATSEDRSQTWEKEFSSLYLQDAPRTHGAREVTVPTTSLWSCPEAEAQRGRDAKDP